MVRLTEMQEKFCENVAKYGYYPVDAARKAGYSGSCRAIYHNIANRLLSNVHIRTRIAEIRDEYFDIEKVRASIIREHQLTRVFDRTLVEDIVEEFDDYGRSFTRIKVKPLEEWPQFARTLLIGWDRYNRPIFKNPENATKELTRIFGLYKDNAVREEEDTSSVLESAGLPADSGVDDAIDEAFEEFDAEELDRELYGIVPGEEDEDSYSYCDD